MATPTYKLSYFDVRGRAELSRLLFTYGEATKGVSWLDDRVPRATCVQRNKQKHNGCDSENAAAGPGEGGLGGRGAACCALRACAAAPSVLLAPAALEWHLQLAGDYILVSHAMCSAAGAQRAMAVNTNARQPWQCL